MKKLIISSILFFCCINFGFSSNENNSLVYVLIDKSGSYEFNPPISAEHIISSVVEDNDSSIEAFVSEINDVSLNAVSRFYLAQGKWYDNPITRQELVDDFYNTMDVKLKEIFEAENGKTKSSIYLWLCRVLNDMSVISAQKKTIIVFSDMMENSDLTTSFYSLHKNGYDFIRSYDEITKTLESAELLDDISGIDIIVVYQPDILTDGLFYETRKFWMKFLTSKKANIRFVANL